MAKWSDILTLISLVPPAEETNENGFNNPPTEAKRDVFANKKSVGYSEFYKSAQAGYSTELKFDIYTHEYGGETLVEHSGARYKVLRTYGSKSGEFLELTLTDLSERAHPPEAPEDAGAGEGLKEGGADG